MRFRHLLLAAAIALSACAGTKVEVEGGGKHPFPKWIVKLNEGKIHKKTTGSEKIPALGESDILDNQFIYSTLTGFELVKQQESLIETYQRAVKTFAQSLAFEQAGG